MANHKGRPREFPRFIKFLAWTLQSQNISLGHSTAPHPKSLGLAGELLCSSALVFSCLQAAIVAVTHRGFITQYSNIQLLYVIDPDTSLLT